MCLNIFIPFNSLAYDCVSHQTQVYKLSYLRDSDFPTDAAHENNKTDSRNQTLAVWNWRLERLLNERKKMIDESVYLIVDCLSVKEMWDCLKNIYLQATKDKEF